MKTRWLDGATYVTVSADLAVLWFTEITGWAPTAENLQFDAGQGLFTVQISYDNPPLAKANSSTQSNRTTHGRNHETKSPF